MALEGRESGEYGLERVRRAESYRSRCGFFLGLTQGIMSQVVIESHTLFPSAKLRRDDRQIPCEESQIPSESVHPNPSTVIISGQIAARRALGSRRSQSLWGNPS